MKFDITNITMTYAKSGGYTIRGIVNGQNVEAHTNDSEVLRLVQRRYRSRASQICNITLRMEIRGGLFR
jgi:hypothetical protein